MLMKFEVNCPPSGMYVWIAVKQWTGACLATSKTEMFAWTDHDLVFDDVIRVTENAYPFLEFVGNWLQIWQCTACVVSQNE